MPAPNHKAPSDPASDAEAAFEAALAARRLGDWQGSLNHLQGAIKLAPRNAKYHAETGAALFMLNRLAEAASAYERALAIDPDHLPSLNNLGVILSLGGRFKEAEALLQRSVAIDATQIETWLNLCSAVEGQDYREDNQVAYARKAVALAPRNPNPYRYLGKALLRQGDPKAALDAFSIARKLDPENADIPYSIAVCHVELDDVPEAVQSFQQALSIDPNHGQTYFALAEFLYRLEEFPAADEAARHAVESHGDKIAAAMLHAKILFARGQYQAGQQCYEAARRRDYAMRQERAGIPAPDSKFVLAPVESVEGWCKRQQLPVRDILPEYRWHPEAPVIFGHRPEHLPLDAVRVPPAYAAEVQDAVVIPGHEVVLVNKEQTALYDRLVQTGDWRWMREDGIVPLISNDHIVVECGPLERQSVESGIFMFSEGWFNYAHWLIEQLPRLYSVECNPEWAGMPLLVNDGLFPQQLESLELLGGNQHPVRILDRGHRHRVRRLIYPTNLTAFHKRRFRPGEQATAADGPFHPQAIKFLRDRLLPQCAANAKPGRRLWLSRKTQKKTGQRRLVNEADIEALFLAHGFESVAPETLSFRQQVKLFAEAEMIAGPGGAAMMNIVFAPPGARTLVFTKNHPQVNFHYFTNIGQIIGHQVAHVCGEHFQTFEVHGFETDFVVPLDSARQAMRQFLGL
jgi:tetratricopeptide (TPR) repeat protein